jgi:hypothetical protein
MEFSQEEDKQIDDISDKLCDAIRGFYSPKIISCSICTLIHAVVKCMKKEERKYFMKSLRTVIESTFDILEEELDDELESSEINIDES